MSLSKTLKDLRTNKKMNQREMAKEIGISTPTLCRAEKGKQLTVVTYGKIHKYLFGW